MKTVSIGDFLTTEQIKKGRDLYLHLRSEGKVNTFAHKFCEGVIKPNIQEINRKLGQANDPMHLAYTLEFALAEKLTLKSQPTQQIAEAPTEPEDEEETPISFPDHMESLQGNWTPKSKIIEEADKVVTLIAGSIIKGEGIGLSLVRNVETGEEAAILCVFGPDNSEHRGLVVPVAKLYLKPDDCQEMGVIKLSEEELKKSGIRKIMVNLSKDKDKDKDKDPSKMD